MVPRGLIAALGAALHGDLEGRARGKSTCLPDRRDARRGIQGASRASLSGHPVAAVQLRRLDVRCLPDEPRGPRRGGLERSVDLRYAGVWTLGSPRSPVGGRKLYAVSCTLSSSMRRRIISRSSAEGVRSSFAATRRSSAIVSSGSLSVNWMVFSDARTLVAS